MKSSFRRSPDSAPLSFNPPNLQGTETVTCEKKSHKTPKFPFERTILKAVTMCCREPISSSGSETALIHVGSGIYDSTFEGHLFPETSKGLLS